MKSLSLAVLNSKVWTSNSSQPLAQSLGICGEFISYVGDFEGIKPLITPETKIIDGEGMLVVPGFIDCHVHFLMGGQRLLSVQLQDVYSKDEFVKKIGDFAEFSEPGSWIIGGDWDHTLWGGEFPERFWIDDVTPENPVWITRKDGHMYLANTLAMEIAGVEDDVQDIEGGTIIRNESGVPTGLFKDNALQLVYPHVPLPTEEESMDALEAGMRYIASNGVTSIHLMIEPPDRNRGGDPEDYLIFQKAHEEGRLTARTLVAFPIQYWEKVHELIENEGKGDDLLRIGQIKGYIDGSLGSHSAAFFEPYRNSNEGYCGDIVNSYEDLYHWISEGDKLGLQPFIHAIGDRGVNICLDLFEQVFKENGNKDRRWRIEHAQHLNEKDIPRFEELGVIASMQPSHIDDMRWAEEIIGRERVREGMYSFRSLLDCGAKLAFGSDWFVCPPSPILGIHCAVNREIDGVEYVPDERITVEEALCAYTIDAAFSSFEEDIKGSLEPGKLADFVLLDGDILSMDPIEIKNTKVLATYLGGEQVF